MTHPYTHSDRVAPAFDNDQRLMTDGGTEEPATFGHVTLMEATNADTQMILLGDREADTHEVVEVLDGSAVYVRRYYEPVDTLELTEKLKADEIGEWIESNRDHDLFDDYDWDEHDRRPLLEKIVDNRNSFRGFISSIERELAEIRTVGVEAGEQLDAIREEMVDVTMDGPSVMVNCVDRPDDDGDSDQAVATDGGTPTIYTTFVDNAGFRHGEWAFEDVDTARETIEEYVDHRYDVELGDWNIDDTSGHHFLEADADGLSVGIHVRGVHTSVDSVMEAVRENDTDAEESEVAA